MKKLSRASSAVAAVAFAAGCGGMTTTNGDAGTDGSVDVSTASDAGTTPDTSLPPFDAGAFCSGPTPRLMINGANAPLDKVSGKAIILNCCDSAELTLATGNFQALMNIMWRAQAGGGGATIDLANPPQGFSIEMDLGCDPATTSCATASPEERYTSGFSGSLQYAMSSAGLTVSYCLAIAESPSQPHQVIHSMQLYAPNVVSP